jgi:hypothetical protein
MTGLDLAGAWLYVQPPLAAGLELEVFDGVRDVHGLAIHAGLIERAVEHRSRWPHEWMTLQVF